MHRKKISGLCRACRVRRAKKEDGSEEPPSNNSGYCTIRKEIYGSLRSLGCFDLLDQFRHDLEQVAHDAVIGHAEDGCALVLVDGDDALRILHAGVC